MNVGISKDLEHDLVHWNAHYVAERTCNLVEYLWHKILMIKNHRRDDIRHQVDSSDHEAEACIRCEELVVGAREYEKVEDA